MAGGKVVNLDRIEWLIIPDRGTAAQALIRGEMRDSPRLSNPQDLEQVMAGVRAVMKARRTYLAIRVPLGPTGVALAGNQSEVGFSTPAPLQFPLAVT